MVELLLGDCLCVEGERALQLAAIVAAAVVDPIHVFADRLGECPIDIRRCIDVTTLSVRFCQIVVLGEVDVGVVVYHPPAASGVLEQPVDLLFVVVDCLPSVFTCERDEAIPEIAVIFDDVQ
jgi:hypothetical protein